MDLWTLKEAAALLGITPAALRMSIMRGQTVAQKLGRDWVITGDQLDIELAKRGLPPRRKDRP